MDSFGAPNRQLAEPELACAVRIPRHVVYTTYCDGTVVLDRSTGAHYSVDKTGARLLQLVAETDGCLSAAVELLAGEQGKQVEDVASGILVFCEDLLQAGLLEVTFQDEGRSGSTTEDLVPSPHPPARLPHVAPASH